MQIEMVPLDKLSLFPGNPRIMSERMMESLVASIKEFGVVDPVIALPDGRIIGGNQRLEAAKKAGFKELPVVRVKLSETKAKKLNIALNKVTGVFDDDGLAVWLRELQAAEENLFSAGFEEEAISQLLAEYDQRHFEAQADEDEIPETPEEPVTKRGDV